MKVADCITTDVVLPNPQTQDPWDEVVVDPALKIVCSTRCSCRCTCATRCRS